MLEKFQNIWQKKAVLKYQKKGKSDSQIKSHGIRFHEAKPKLSKYINKCLQCKVVDSTEDKRHEKREVGMS